MCLFCEGDFCSFLCIHVHWCYTTGEKKGEANKIPTLKGPKKKCA